MIGSGEVSLELGKAECLVVQSEVLEQKGEPDYWYTLAQIPLPGVAS